MEAFTDAVRLRALGLGARVIDVLDREIQLVLVPFRVAAELAAAVSQYAQERVEGSSYPNLIGGEQKRVITLLTADELRYTNPTTSTGTKAESVWRRAK